MVVSKFITVRYPDEHDFYVVWDWCKTNCLGKFYSGTDWDYKRWRAGEQNRIYQFESEKDATVFILKWL